MSVCISGLFHSGFCMETLHKESMFVCLSQEYKVHRTGQFGPLSDFMASEAFQLSECRTKTATGPTDRNKFLQFLSP